MYVQRQFPKYAWAVQELPRSLELDDLCVELEIITGVPAVTVRGQALGLRLDMISETYAENLYMPAYWIGTADARLACWMSCAAIQNVLSQRADMSEWCAPFVRAIEEWCLYFKPRAFYDASSVPRSIPGILSMLIATDSATNLTVPGRQMGSDGVSAERTMRSLIAIPDVDLEAMSAAYKSAMMTYPVRQVR